MAKLFPPGYVFTHHGSPVSSGGVIFYDTGTTTQRNIFTDAALSVAATNSRTTTPKGQPLNSDGRFSQGDIYGSGTYTVVLFDSSGGTIWSRDDFDEDTLRDDGLDTRITANQTTDILTFRVDAVDAVKFGWQKVADTGFINVDPKAFTADATENTHRVAILAGNAITIPAGTTTLASAVYIIEPNITATGTLTNAATVYIKDAPTEATNNYAVWVDGGAVRFDSTLAVTGATTITGALTHSGYVGKTKLADTSRSSTATLADDDHLAGFILAVGEYIIEAAIIVTSTSSTPDFKYAMQVVSGTVSDSGVAVATVEHNGAATRIVTATFVAAQSWPVTLNLPIVTTIHGHITISVAAVLDFQWAQNTSDGTATILKEGSYIKFTAV